MLPSFPMGASVDSMLRAVYRLNQSRSWKRAMVHFYGKKVLTNTLARHASVLAKNAFQGRISGEDLILHHSAWPILSRLVPKSAAGKWFEECLSGDGDQMLRRWRSFHAGTVHARAWRSCIDCVSADQSVHGTGHWHIVHQLQGATHCARHGRPLDEHCAGCRSPLGSERMMALPGESCEHCGSMDRAPSGVAASPGLARLAQLYSDLMVGAGPDLDLTSRAELHRRAIANRTGPDPIGDHATEFISSFGCSSVEQLDVRLGVHVTLRAIRAALIGGSHACPPVVHLALAAFSLQGLSATPSLRRVDQSIELIRTFANSPAEPIERILTAAEDAGFPTEAIVRRFAGSTVEALKRDGLAYNRTWWKFVASLPPELRDHLPQRRERAPDLSLCLSRDNSIEDARRIHRERIQSAMERRPGPRKNWRGLCVVSLMWCNAKDRAWLDEIAPRQPTRTKIVRSFEEDRAHYRERIQRALLAGPLKRGALNQVCSHAYRWCKVNDQEWLDKISPM